MPRREKIFIVIFIGFHPAHHRRIASMIFTGDPLAERFPLQIVTFHCKTRAHSNFYNVQWLRELEAHEIWIHPKDADPRGIVNGEGVRVFNGRGETRVHAKVTQRIMPGVVAIGQGTWYCPDKDGVDHGGCANVLIRDEGSPAGATPTNSTLVEINKLEGAIRQGNQE